MIAALRPIASLQRSARPGLIGVAMAAALLTLLTAGSALAANAAPVQVFYVTLPEADAYSVLDAINDAAVSPMYTYFSVSIATDGTYVYYDQWEDGYAGDVANPTSSEVHSGTNTDGVQIWGNGEADDGCAPNIAGVPVSCTDANDVLNAGDVIIPYNAIALPRNAPTAYVLDNFGAVSYSNNNGNTNWAGNWVETGDLVNQNYRDEFADQAYDNSVGSLDWSGSSWVEENDDGSPSSGTIIINASADDLRFRVDSTANDAIKRRADLSGYSSALLSFELDGVVVDADDDIAVEISDDGGSTWTELGRFDSNNDPGGAATQYDITSYIASNTTIRFIMIGSLGSGERWDIDDVDLTVAVSSPSSGDIQVTSAALRFTATDAGDSIDRGADLSAGGSCATLGFTLGQSGIDAGNDRLAVQVSSDGGTTFTTLETFDAAADAGAKTYDVSAYASANTRVRFVSVDGLESSEYWTIDDARIDWNCVVSTLFDARDKIGATRSIAMARAIWASGSGTLNAFAHEMVPTSEWGTAYESPVGCNTASPGTDMFEYSALSIMASRNDTVVEIDGNTDGTYESSVTLDEGGTYLADYHDWPTGCDYVRQGARVRTTSPSHPIQAVLLTGDIGSNYESRDINLLPVRSFGTSYWSPVGVHTDGDTTWATGPTRLWLYNPSTNGGIHITCERRAPTPTTVIQSVAAGGVVTVDLNDNSAGHCFASNASGTATNEPIFGIGTVDTGSGGDGQAWDWSFTLFADSFLETEAVVGLGLGKDPTDETSNENGSPLWVTPVADTYVYVDWDGNGSADNVDLNGDGDTNDTVDGISEGTSNNGMQIDRLQSVRLFEPPLDEEEYDQSAARVWSRTASGVGYAGTPGEELALAWGEDPRTADPATPGLDVGTSVPPLREIETSKAMALKTDVDGDGQLSAGDKATYQITIENTGASLVGDVFVYDLLPANMTYAGGTTQWNRNEGAWTTIVDLSGAVLPLSDTSSPPPDGAEIGDLPSGDTFHVRFDVTLSTSALYDEVSNCNTAFTAAGTFSSCVNTQLPLYDWGDLPDSYGTTLVADGPRHAVYPDTNGDGLPNALDGDTAIWLGAKVDRELNGAPGSAADGDDDTGARGDDEDDVTLVDSTKWFEGTNGATVRIDSSRSDTANGNGWLMAWFDWNHDGDFDDDEEAVVSSAADWSGTSASQAFTFDVPTGGLNADLSYRVRLFDATSSPGASAYGGEATNGEVEDSIAPVDTLPVTLSYFAATTRGENVHFEWTTSTAVGNLGFNLYAWRSDRAVRINEAPIPAMATTSLQPQDYEFDAETDGTVFFLEELSVRGGLERFGPFEVNRPAGGRARPMPIDWAPIRSEHGANEVVRHAADARQVQDRVEARSDPSARPSAQEDHEGEGDQGNQGAAPIDGAAPMAKPTSRWPTHVPWLTTTPLATTVPHPEPTATPAPAVRIADLGVSRTGIYRLTHDALAAAGIDLTNQPAADLALTRAGRSVPIRVAGAPSIGAGTFIEFYGEALDTIYTDTNIYTLWLDRTSALRIAADNSAPDGSQAPPLYYMATESANRQIQYSVGPPGSDPWCEQEIVAYRGAPRRATVSIALDNLVVGPAPILDVELWGVTDWPSSPDHHVVLRFNDAVVADQWFDGRVVLKTTLPLPRGLARPGENSIAVALPADLPADIVGEAQAIDRYAVTYPRAFVARDGHLAFTAQSPVLKVSGLGSREVVVYRLDDGVPSYMATVIADGRSAVFAGSPSAADYVVSTVEAVLSPSILPARRAADIRAGAAAYLVIAHPDFINPDLYRLLEARAAQGLTVKVVDVRDIYAAYSFGVFEAQAIRDYIRFAAANLGTDFVLLVGGDTYDYRDYTGAGVPSFIPSLYAATDACVTHAPVDPAYADLDGDGVPDISVGRLPVRSAAHLRAMVDKTLAYAAKTYARTGFFAAEKGYARHADSFIGQLPAGWSTATGYIGPGDLSVAAAKERLLAAVNNGVALTSFVGHSSDWEWTWDGLFNATDAAQLTNVGRPTVITQWGCWSTYYVDPKHDTLGHRLTNAATGGAAVLGAVALSSEPAERQFGDLLTPWLTRPGVPIGVAVLAAKQELAGVNPVAKDVLLGWTLLGDPALVVQP